MKPTTPSAGLGWAQNRIASLASLAIAALIAPMVTPLAQAAPGTETAMIDVIVREAVPASDAAEDLVTAAGGLVGETLSIIGGFSASVPADRLAEISASVHVAAATPDGTIETLRSGWQDATNLGNYSPNEYKGSMLHTGYAVGVDGYWADGFTGEGIGVALIDTGVAPVHGLDADGKVINGPDLSFDGQISNAPGFDANGHGTHMAGIIAGRDAAAPANLTVHNGESYFLGVAPDAHIVNMKVGAYDGAVDVSQVIAAIDWVVQHKDDPGMNVRVMNLSFGTDSAQDPLLDPLSFAVEAAWHAGIVVVVASGNDGNEAPVRNPATNPYVITVGAADYTRAKGRDAQPIPDWSNCGTTRTVDLIAPGASIVSLRVPKSQADLEHPAAKVADRFFLGSGTSQAAAVTSGAAALILARNPEYSPDDVKTVLMSGADPYRKVTDECQGAGQINLHDTSWISPTGSQRHATAMGTGTLQGARGSDYLVMDRVILEGEQDIMGNEWDSATWTEAVLNGGSWSGEVWNGASWSGGSWSGGSWSGGSWSGGSWSGGSWSGGSWSGGSWSGGGWQ